MNQFSVYLVNQNSGQTYPLDSKKDNIIGRGIENENPDATICFPDASISKKHAIIKLDPDTHLWIFENLSRNGSMINDELVSKQKTLKHGDQVSIGPFELSFYEKLRIDEGTMELPIAKRKKAASFAKDWEDEESTPLGTAIESIVMIFFIALSVFIFLCCFVW